MTLNENQYFIDEKIHGIVDPWDGSIKFSAYKYKTVKYKTRVTGSSVRLLTDEKSALAPILSKYRYTHES